ncbi:MAG: hypothetical protein ILP19_06735 [Oscillospiraceae bacterium]|nr:hypothetical protein [Oscillospiraceae bacterium]
METSELLERSPLGREAWNDTKNKRYKFQLIDFDRSADSVKAICDEIDKYFSSVKNN